MRQTPLFELQKAAGARFVPFGDWQLPVQFSGIQEEHHRVRNHAGLFDVSHMGEIEILGPEALSAFNRLISNDLELLKDGQACYTMLCRQDGGILDDLVVYRFSPQRIFICCNANNRHKDFAWIQKHLQGEARVYDLSDEYAQLALQGPKAQEILQTLTPTLLKEIAFYHFAEAQVAKVPVILSRTGYTGEDGFELYIPWEQAPQIWEALMEADPELLPVGLGARNTLRLEMKFALYGQEITEENNPLEAGLAWVCKLSKAEFIGREALLTLKAEGLKRRLVAFKLQGRAIPRQGYKILDELGEVIGEVTSGSYSPSLKASIGVAYVPQGRHRVGTPIHVQIRRRVEEGLILRAPFYRRPKEGEKS